MMHSHRKFLGDLISTGASGAAAAAQVGASGGATTNANAVAAAARLTAVAQTNSVAAQRNATQGTAIATAITGALAAVAGAAGGPAGQWLSFLLGGTTAPPSTTIAPNDLKTLKDVLVTAVPISTALLEAAKLGVPTDETAKAVLNYFIAYLPRVQAAAVAACTAGGPNCGVGAPAPATPAIPETPYYPPNPGGGGGGTTQQTSEAGYLLPLGAVALAAIYYFMRR